MSYSPNEITEELQDSIATAVMEARAKLQETLDELEEVENTISDLEGNYI